MMRNFENTESWEDKASKTRKLAIASWHRPTSLFSRPISLH